MGSPANVLAGRQELVASAAAVNAAAPEPVVSRNAEGDVTVRAVRINRPITLDGRLNEEIYATVVPTGDFIQQEPREGAPATEPTDIWIFFDDKNLYFAARCWDSHPERQVSTEMRRDAQPINNSNESLAIVFDTFHDRRNGFFFQTTPLGTVRDQAIVSETLNDDWNTVWDVKVDRFERGYTLEMVIPFKSLRYPGAGAQVWGFNVRRLVKWKNEFQFLTKVPAVYGTSAIARLAFAGTLVGVETPAQSMNLEVKPYGVSSLTTDRTASLPFDNAFDGTGGVDLKYGLTRGLIADATFNTDFAQVEEDLQQVNLTRFSLFFPEKRDFFLEGQGIFGFGGVEFGNGGGSPGNVPVMFFSRRIGLSQNQSVPIQAGGRLTGKAGRLTLGGLNIQTSDKPEAGAVETNFSVARFKWDILRRSTVGLIATRRSPTTAAHGSNHTIGADTTLRLRQAWNIYAYYAQTDTPGLDGNSSSYRGRFEYATDRYGLFAEHLTIGEHFNPEVGYVRRADLRENFLQARFSPRPKNTRLVRKYTYQGSLDYLTDARQTAVQNKQARGTFTIDFSSSNQFSLDYLREYELLPRNFPISPGVIVPAGGYDYVTARASYTLGQQHKVSGRTSVATGSFYGGTKREVSYTGRVVGIPRFAVEPSISLNWVDLPYGEFNATLLNSRFIVTPTPRMLISSLVQFNAIGHSLSSSVRLRWEYIPGSELFVVYSDGRDTAVRGVPYVMNRTFAMKITRLVRF